MKSSLEKKSGMYVFRLRKLTGKSQNEFAEVLQCTRSYIAQLENNYVDISLSTFMEWIELFEIEDVRSVFVQENFRQSLDS